MQETPLGNISSAILFVTKPQLVDGFRAELKDHGVTRISIVSSEDECIEQLVLDGQAMLVLDWDIGPAIALSVLESCLRPVPTDVRPILLLAASSSINLIGVAAEFGVTRLHRGEMSRVDMKATLDEIFRSESELPDEVRDKLSLAGDARRRDDWMTAHQILESLHRDFPASVPVTMEYSENLLHIGQCQEGIDLLTPLAEQPDAPIRLLYTLGRCLMKVDRYTDATIVFERAKALNPMNVDRLVQLGLAYLETNETIRAQQNFDQALEIDQDNDRAKSGKGQCLLLQGEINQAVSFLKSVSSPEEKAAIFNSAAVLSMRNGKFDEGMNLYQIAVRVVGGLTSVLAKLSFNMGVGYHRFKQPEKALTMFKAATRLDPLHEGARRNVEVMEMQMGIVEDYSALDGHPLAAYLPKPAKKSAPAPVVETTTSKSKTIGADFEEEDVIRRAKKSGSAA